MKLRSIRTLWFACMAGALVVGALWAWESARDLVADLPATRPEAGVWAVRCVAFAAAAFAQVVLLGWVVNVIYPKRGLDEILRTVFSVACAAALICAVALGLTAR